MSIQSLLNTLEQKVQQLTQAYQADSDKKINAKSVSYTHLDVYKRQILNNRM